MKVISGGQTGADRGALEAAMDHGLPHGGFCPKGRRAEDGQIPSIFDMTELFTTSYQHRTKQNVLASDATLILITSMPPTSGSKLTAEMASKARKPWIYASPIVAFDEDLISIEADQDVLPYFLTDPNYWQAPSTHVLRLAAWLKEINPAVLNVAGSRESKSPGIQAATREFMNLVFSNLQSQQVPWDPSGDA